MPWQFLKKNLAAFVFTRHNTPRKFLNLLRISWQHFITRPDRVSGYPVRLIIDSNNQCQLSCPLCPTGQKKMGRPGGQMSIQLFKSILDETAAYLYEIDLFCWGEPLLNRNLPAMIKLAQERNVRVRVSSNLNHLPPALADELVASGLEELVVSLDGLDQASYEKYRQGGSYQKVLDNLALLQKEKKRQGSKYPRLVWQYLVFQHNESGLTRARQGYRSLGFDRFLPRPARADMGTEIITPDAEKIANSSGWLPTEEKLSRYSYSKKKKKYSPRSCLFLWTQAVINHDGGVSPCCAVFDQKDDFGTLNPGTSLLSIWNNQTYQGTRQMVRSRQKTSQGICNNCLDNGFIEY